MKAQHGLTAEQAIALKKAYLAKYPEVARYFAYVREERLFNREWAL